MAKTKSLTSEEQKDLTNLLGKLRVKDIGKHKIHSSSNLAKREIVVKFSGNLKNSQFEQLVSLVNKLDNITNSPF